MRETVRNAAYQERYAGIGFMKSRKSDDKMMHIAGTMIEYAARKEIVLFDVITDESSGKDIDRKAIDRLVQWMEKEFIKVVLVRSILEITTDNDDLQKFLRKAEELGVSVYSLEKGCNSCDVPWEGGFECERNCGM